MINAKTYAATRRQLTEHNPAGINHCIWFVGMGDSILAGIGGGDGSSVSGGAWSFYVTNAVTSIGKLTKGQNAIGGYSSVVALAERLREQTGWCSVFTMISKSSTSGVYESWEGRTPKYHWDVGHDDGNMLQIVDGVTDRSTILPLSKAAIDRCPGIDVQKTYLLWAGGSFDAAGIIDGIVTQADITNRMIDLKNWTKTNYGADGMFFYESSSLGSTLAEAVLDQETTRDMVGLRTAQNAAATADAEIWNVYPHAADPGTPFNTLAVNADGTWREGHSLHDGAHYSEAMQTCIGYTAAQVYIAPIVGMAPS